MTRKYPITKVCINCNEEYETKETKQKFCSRSCSTSYTNKQRDPISDNQKNKISKSMKRYWDNNPDKIRRGEEAAKAVAKATKGKYKKNIKSIYDVSNRSRMKIIERLEISCSKCGWNETICDIHHIIPRSEGGTHKHSNLTCLCPNCHRLAHRKLLNDFRFRTLDEQIGDRWKTCYYG